MDLRTFSKFYDPLYKILSLLLHVMGIVSSYLRYEILTFIDRKLIYSNPITAPKKNGTNK